MTRHVPHVIRAPRHISFARVKHTCGHWELHAFWTRTAQELEEANGQCELLITQVCPQCRAHATSSPSERSHP